jgi:hypothetical protein
MRLSVILTRLASKYISLRATCSFRASATPRTTRASKCGTRRAPVRNARTSRAATSGGNNCSVSSGFNRGPWRAISSSAGRRRSSVVRTKGRRYIRRRVKNMLRVSVSGWWIRLQYLSIEVESRLMEWVTNSIPLRFVIVSQTVYVYFQGAIVAPQSSEENSSCFKEVYACILVDSGRLHTPSRVPSLGSMPSKRSTR